MTLDSKPTAHRWAVPALITACALLVATSPQWAVEVAHEALVTPRPPVAETAAPLPTATTTATPTPPALTALAPTQINNLPGEQALVWLERLVYLECGFNEDCGLSVISTVEARMMRQYLSDGTLQGTLSWNSDGTWQFPPSVVFACNEQAVMCPDDVDLSAARQIVLDYYVWGERGSCDGYLHYGSVEGWPQDCTIVVNDRVAGFFNDWSGQ